jgi:hypothetical protein
MPGSGYVVKSKNALVVVAVVARPGAFALYGQVDVENVRTVILSAAQMIVDTCPVVNEAGVHANQFPRAGVAGWPR